MGKGFIQDRQIASVHSQCRHGPAPKIHVRSCSKLPATSVANKKGMCQHLTGANQDSGRFTREACQDARTGHVGRHVGVVVFLGLFLFLD